MCMHKGTKKFSKKKESKLTLKHHSNKHNEENQKLSVAASKIEEGFRQKQGYYMKKRKARPTKRTAKATPKKKSAWTCFWKKYFSF